MNIVHVAAELAPWAATGGLAEVVAALPDAQASAGHQVSVVLPGYKRAMDALVEAGAQPRRVGELLELHLDDRTIAFAAFVVERAGADLWLLTNIELFDRPGLYGDDHGGYDDNPLRFAAFCHAARLLMLRGYLGAVDVAHVHDWHAAVVPALTQRLGGPPTVLTIHNLGYQGTCAASWMSRIGLPHELFALEGFEFHGKLNLLKGGIVFADALTTVSPTYAEQILTPAHGCHLDGLLRHVKDKLHGVLNGIGDNWDPSSDVDIAASFDVGDIAAKAHCRDSLCADFGLQPAADEPVFGIVSRLAWQKGLDVLADVTPGLVSRGVLAIVGSGQPDLEARFRNLATRYPGRVGLFLGYSPRKARQLFAGADAFVMPSRYEPCGLGQMQAMRYGALPIVHATGGLRDSVRHGVTGFSFEVLDGAGLSWACLQALQAWEDKTHWAKMQRAAMTTDFSWKTSANAYDAIYRSVAG